MISWGSHIGSSKLGYKTPCFTESKFGKHLPSIFNYYLWNKTIHVLVMNEAFFLPINAKKCKPNSFDSFWFTLPGCSVFALIGKVSVQKHCFCYLNIQKRCTKNHWSPDKFVAEILIGNPLTRASYNLIMVPALSSI